MSAEGLSLWQAKYFEDFGNNYYRKNIFLKDPASRERQRLRRGEVPRACVQYPS